ncbi:MAG: hypothetical protein HQL82_02245 [Magnetococcales bacterium]|nr:hypothetical protein [Magnetococcales bacterium]
MTTLTELEEDALKEFFNLGLGTAADQLSRMLDNEVLLDLPKLAMVSHEQALNLVSRGPEQKMVAIRQNFHGTLTGTALLIFPGSGSLEMVRTLTREDIPLEELTALEQETLLDVGNVVLNAFLGSFTQMMALKLEFESAEFLKADSEHILRASTHLASQPLSEGTLGAVADEPAFFLMMDFQTHDDQQREHTLNGYVVLLFTQTAMATLKHELERILVNY